MPTLLSVGNSEGSRRCDAKCYQATGPDCCCICGGANHGKGYAGAIAENERRFGSEELRAELKVYRQAQQLGLFEGE